MSLTVENIIDRYSQFGYKLFTEGDYNLNIFGIRSKERRAGFFDDTIGCIWKENKQWKLFLADATVDCGEYYMKNPMNPSGSAFLVEGQYLGLWELGVFHKTAALLQKKPCRYYRDNDRDNIIELDPKTITSGNIGLFLHSHFQYGDEAQLIYNSSAACQVFKRNKDLNLLIGLCYQSKARYGNSFTYTLFND
jgi:hypothetical protein